MRCKTGIPPQPIPVYNSTKPNDNLNKRRQTYKGSQHTYTTQKDIKLQPHEQTTRQRRRQTINV